MLSINTVVYADFKRGTNEWDITVPYGRRGEIRKWGVNQRCCSNQAAFNSSVRRFQKSSHQSSALNIRKASIGSIDSGRRLAPGIFNLFCGIDLCALCRGYSYTVYGLKVPPVVLIAERHARLPLPCRGSLGYRFHTLPVGTHWPSMLWSAKTSECPSQAPSLFAILTWHLVSLLSVRNSLRIFWETGALFHRARCYPSRAVTP